MDVFVVHCKQSFYDVYIGRGSVYGNPFTHLPIARTKALIQVSTRERSVEAYEAWLLGQWWKFSEASLLALVEVESQRQAILNTLPGLRGKVLGCWCAPLSCHGDVLVRLANRGD